MFLLALELKGLLPLNDPVILIVFLENVLSSILFGMSIQLSISNRQLSSLISSTLPTRASWQYLQQSSQFFRIIEFLCIVSLVSLFQNLQQSFFRIYGVSWVSSRASFILGMISSYPRVCLLCLERRLSWSMQMASKTLNILGSFSCSSRVVDSVNLFLMAREWRSRGCTIMLA